MPKEVVVFGPSHELNELKKEPAAAAALRPSRRRRHIYICI
jgi:hypothetical protein